MRLGETALPELLKGSCRLRPLLSIPCTAYVAYEHCMLRVKPLHRGADAALHGEYYRQLLLVPNERATASPCPLLWWAASAAPPLWLGGLC